MYLQSVTVLYVFEICDILWKTVLAKVNAKTVIKFKVLIELFIYFWIDFAVLKP